MLLAFQIFSCIYQTNNSKGKFFCSQEDGNPNLSLTLLTIYI